jgi:hypothetical protein
MRARLTMKLVGLAVMLALTLISLHSCGTTSPSSPLNPATLERNGLDGLCANQQALAQATGQSTPQTLALPAAAGGLAALGGLPGGSFSCPSP